MKGGRAAHGAETDDDRVVAVHLGQGASGVRGSA
jgi:hypothetical protein